MLNERIHVFAIISVASFVILYYFMLYSVYKNSLQVFIQMNGLNYAFLSLVFNAIISVFIGTFVSLFNYRMRIMKNYGYTGSIGAIVGGFAAGCPTCGAFLFSLIGFPLALMRLPFRGLELKVLSILLLLVSIHFMSLNIYKYRVKKR